MTYNQEYLDTLAEERAFSVESSDGATFHFGVAEGHHYLIGVSFLFSAEYTSLFHLACVDGKGQKTEDYELLEPQDATVDRAGVEFAGKFILYKVSRAEVERAHRLYEQATQEAWSSGRPQVVKDHDFKPSIDPTRAWLAQHQWQQEDV